MQRANTVLNLKIPTKVRAELTPDFISKRIPEILGAQKYLEFQVNYYKYIYTWFMTTVGYPIRDVYTEKVPHDKLSIGDVIVIEEVGNYGRLYQCVPNDDGFLILEQVADSNSHPDIVIWKTVIKGVPNHIVNVGKYEAHGEIIYNLKTLEYLETHLYRYFKNYLNFFPYFK